MKTTWWHYLRRLAAVSVASGSVAWSSAMCYAQNSYDDATDPAYADGWQEGDNGGTGFTPWNFDSAYFWPVDGNWYAYAHADFHAIDDGLQNGTHYSNPFNNIDRSWAMGASPDNDGTVRAGRGFSPLEIGDTINVIVDNPTDRQFFKGYFIRLNSTFDSSIDGMPINGNICNGAGANCTPEGTPPAHKMYLSRFEYFDDGEWLIVDVDDPGPPVSDFTRTGVFDTETAAGARFSVTRTGTDTYDVLLDPAGPGPSFSNPTPFTFDNPGVPVNWIEFEFFNSVTDTGTPPTIATDLYIRSIEIIRAAAPGLLGDFNEDDMVDAADYVVWRKAQQLGLDGLPNDEDAAGPIGAAEYNLWRSHFGESPPGSGAGAAAGLSNAAVPEPSAFIIACAALAGFVVHQRTRSQS